MMKSISNILKTDKERYKVPRKVQDVIPIKRIWPDGIFLVGSKDAKSWKFTDINYLVAYIPIKFKNVLLKFTKKMLLKTIRG